MATVLMNSRIPIICRLNHGLKLKILKHLPNSGTELLFKAILSASEESASRNPFKKHSVLLKVY